MFPKTSIEWMEKLVSFDTVSRNSNLAIVQYISGFLDSVGVKYSILKDDSGKKASIFATIPPQSGAISGGIVFSGHLDVVPVDGQKWDTDPFKATTKGDKIFGRGTCDMKGFIGVCLSLVPEFLRKPRSRPIYLAFTYDEEIGCLGGRQLTAFIKKNNIKPDGCVVGEPTSNKVIVAHKGISCWNVTVEGLAAHSSFALTKKSCNAIDGAAKLIVKIREIAEDIQTNGAKDSHFDVPFTSMSTNTIVGGNALNTVPAFCKFGYEFRNLPAVSQEAVQRRVQEYIDAELLPKMKQEYAGAKITLENIAQVPSMRDADEKDPFVMLVRKLTSDRDVHKLGATTEAGQYAIIGVPVVVCGPGSIAIAHQANEFVPVQEMKDCEKIVRALVMKNQASSHV